MTSVNYKDELLSLSQFQNRTFEKQRKKKYIFILQDFIIFLLFLLIFHLFGRRFPLPYFILLSFFSCFTSHFRILGYRSPRGWIHDGLKIRIDRMLGFGGKFRRKDWILRLGGGCFVSFYFRLKYTVGSPRDTNAIVNRDGEKGRPGPWYMNGIENLRRTCFPLFLYSCLPNDGFVWKGFIVT